MASAFSADREGYEKFQKALKVEERMSRFQGRLDYEIDEVVSDFFKAQVEECRKEWHKLLDDFGGYPAGEIHNIWNEIYRRISGKSLSLSDIPDMSDL